MFGERSSKYKHFKHSKNAFNVFIIHRGVNVERKSGTIFQLETDQRMFSIVIWSFLIQSIIPHTKHAHTQQLAYASEKGVRQVKYYLVIDYGSKNYMDGQWTWIACIIVYSVHYYVCVCRLNSSLFHAYHNPYHEQWNYFHNHISCVTCWPCLKMMWLIIWLLDSIKGVNCPSFLWMGKFVLSLCYYLHIDIYKYISLSPQLTSNTALKLINACSYMIFG